ncbi:beta-1,6-N-acetylglucosaminyltransferase [Lacticaseibacillus suilingensis]|uniref:Peptide O-xylosyltransferase n=2 Tax=Lacticaseibacillus suilingensis TaxID=2799577 RepID=A0ABW4BGT2_9LACO|nr:beta-1,6-N-acetylglucosaminyltransferase [Lacticaseibacillus suilingensis]
MRKHAYLVIAHNNVNLLNRLITVLDDPRNDIFLHIDKKVADNFLKEINTDLKYSKLYFSERVDVHWGAYSQILSELSLLRRATAEGTYAYYHLLSGVDLPIKSQDKIHAFFDSIQGKELVQFQKPIISKEKLERVERYYWLQETDIRSRPVLGLIQRVLIKLQRSLRINRLSNTSLNFQMGSNWFSITDDLARYVLSESTRYLPFFKYSQCADELFIQTIIINSPSFLSRLFKTSFDDAQDANMRFIQWVNHAPRDLTVEDFSALANSPLLFARKFNPGTDSEIIDKVLEHLT